MIDERARHPKLPTDTDDGLLLIISGPSGVGKTTITRGVERGIRGSVFSVSCTTRPMTDADVEGVDYRFINREAFDEMEAGDLFLETADVFGNKYGTPRDWVDEQLLRGRLVILEIDVLGAKQVKDKMPEAFGIFIMPPSEDELLRRLRSREREDEDVIQKRFAEARREIAEAQDSHAYDLFITNTVLDDSIEEALTAVRAERSARRTNGVEGEGSE